MGHAKLDNIVHRRKPRKMGQDPKRKRERDWERSRGMEKGKKIRKDQRTEAMMGKERKK